MDNCNTLIPTKKLDKIWKYIWSYNQSIGGGLAGQAFTPYTCLKCDLEFMHENTNTPIICRDCSNEIRGSFNQQKDWCGVIDMQKKIHTKHGVNIISRSTKKVRSKNMASSQSLIRCNSTHFGLKFYKGISFVNGCQNNQKPIYLTVWYTTSRIFNIF